MSNMKTIVNVKELQTIIKNVNKVKKIRCFKFRKYNNKGEKWTNISNKR